MKYWIIFGIFLAVLILFIIIIIKLLRKKDNNKPKEGNVYWSNDWKLNGFVKKNKHGHSKNDNRMFVVRNIDRDKTVSISILTKSGINKKENYRLKKEKYPKLEYDSCVKNRKSSMYVIDKKPNDCKRGDYKNLRKEKIKTNNKQLFNEFSFKLNPYDRKELKKLFPNTPDKEDMEKLKEIKLKEKGK